MECMYACMYGYVCMYVCMDGYVWMYVWMYGWMYPVVPGRGRWRHRHCGSRNFHYPILTTQQHGIIDGA